MKGSRSGLFKLNCVVVLVVVLVAAAAVVSNNATETIEIPPLSCTIVCASLNRISRKPLASPQYGCTVYIFLIIFFWGGLRGGGEILDD